MRKLGVVYLSRKANPPQYFEFFLRSLTRHSAGHPYDLVVIQKGYADHAQDPRLVAFAADGHEATVLYHADDSTFATNCFFDVARAYDYEFLLFFVSWSRILAANWARIMLAGFECVPGCGVVGASAGYEALNDTTPFPNRSIRTTGFLIRRETFLALNPGPLASKYDGNLFEAGPNSMTRQIERMGLKAVVARRDGTYCLPERWPTSLTFRSGDQEQLIFADNRTMQYAVASGRKREKLGRLNWGDAAITRSVPLWTRLRRKVAWRYGL
jgi:hypothetical protein